MSWSGMSAQISSNCGRCLLRSNPLYASANTIAALRQPLRHASTAVKPRAKKTSSVASEDVALGVTKKALSTKSSASTPKAPRKKKTDESLLEAVASEAVLKKKQTRAVSTKASKKTEAAAPVTNTSAPAARKSVGTAIKRTSPATPTKDQAAPRFVATPGEPERLPSSTSHSLPGVESAAPLTAFEASPEMQPPVDIKSPEYKQAVRKYTSLMVALPILLVTSYYLFDRLVRGNEPGNLAAFRSPPSAEDKVTEQEQ
ncbi:hypothetical protein B0H63DRAFT_522733 [Podospora didyma]|uniref:Uncharacterized protein n=1 Tax=Podospora didyma TaxID=330526 RepID=A0AAE0NPN4_9PEZI|nr:hypothetical protein B0H63DRAFT_522733 [Podospora didyma]